MPARSFFRLRGGRPPRLELDGLPSADQSRPARPASCAWSTANTSDPNTLDPQLAQATNESAILRELFEGLYADGPHGEPIPGLAKSAQTSADGLTWTFKLRPWRWSDGVPLTARDFVFAYRHMLDPQTGSSYSYLLYVLKNGAAVSGGHMPLTAGGAQALDDETLQLTLEHPASYLPQLLKHQAFYPIPAHVVQRWGAGWVKQAHYVGDGPYDAEGLAARRLRANREEPPLSGRDSGVLRSRGFLPHARSDHRRA